MSMRIGRSKENNALKVNIAGIIGGILALISLALPWWTISMLEASTSSGTSVSMNINVYTFQATVSGSGYGYSAGSSAAFFNGASGLWYGWIALLLVLVAGVIGLVVSLIPDKVKLLAIGAVLSILSPIIFALGLQFDVIQRLQLMGSNWIGLFGGYSYSLYGETVTFSSYLSFGFWVSIVAAVLMLLALRMKPAVAAVSPPPPPPPAPVVQ